MNFCISIGQIHKKLYFLLLAVLYKILRDLVYGVKYTEEFGNTLYIYNSILKDHQAFKSLIKFFGIIVFSFVYKKYESYQLYNTEINNNNVSNIKQSNIHESNEDKSKFSLIHNEIEVEIDNTKYTTQILFTIFLLLFVELILQIYNLFAKVDTDYWSLEIFFTVFFIKKILKIKLYRHQIFSMIFILIFCTTMKTLSFRESYKKKPFNLNLLFIFIPCYLIIALIRSYVYTKIKWLMDIRYITIPKMLFIFGIFGFIVSLIICILTCIFPHLIGDAFGHFDLLSYSIDWGKFVIETFLIIIYMFLNFYLKFYDMLTLKTFTPIHVLANNSLYFLLIQIILMISNGVNDESGEYIVFSFLSHIFAIFGYFVFVELIEIKCCNCNLNLRKNIIKRSQIESVTGFELNEEGNQQIEIVPEEEEENSNQSSFSLNSSY